MLLEDSSVMSKKSNKAECAIFVYVCVYTNPMFCLTLTKVCLSAPFSKEGHTLFLVNGYSPVNHHLVIKTCILETDSKKPYIKLL